MRFVARYPLALLVFAAASLLGLGPSAAEAPTAGAVAGADDLFKRMEAVNAKLKTYSATLHMDAKLKSFIPLSQSVDGNLYFKQPDHQAVVFDSVPPMIGDQFKKVYPKIEPPAAWKKIYDVTPLSNESGVTTFRLIPKKNGRVEHLDVNVDDGNATIKGYTWTYKDGGSITFEQTLKLIDGNYLPETLTGHVDLPSYKADVTSRLSKFKLNVPIEDSVFEQK